MTARWRSVLPGPQYFELLNSPLSQAPAMNISSAQPYFESNSTSITFKDVPNPIANFFAMWFAHDDTALEINETIHKSRAFNAVEVVLEWCVPDLRHQGVERHSVNIAG